MRNRPGTLSIIGAAVGILGGFVAANLFVGFLSALFIGPIRSDLIERDYGAYITLGKVAVILGSALGAWIGFRVGGSYDEDRANKK